MRTDYFPAVVVILKIVSLVEANRGDTGSSNAGGANRTQTASCWNATQLNDLDKRLVGYDGGGEKIGDYYLPEGWYSMRGYVLTKTDHYCWTPHPWHIIGELPKDMTEKTLQVCDETCTSKKPVKVQKCSTDDYVFYLQQLDTFNAAYCIEYANGESTKHDLTAPKISFATPRISVDVLRIRGENNLHFYCDFTPTDNTLLYTVEWALSSGRTILRQIVKIESVLFDADFRETTALNENHLKAINHHRLGITIMCSVTAQKDAAGSHSQPVESSPKFCGIEILQKGLINIKVNDDAEIRLRSTIPFGCSAVQNNSCTLNVNVFVPKYLNTCELPSVKFIRSERIPCGVTISRNKYNEIQTFKLKRIGAAITGKMNRLFVLQFRVEAKHPDHPIFANYFLNKVRVNIQADSTKLIGKECYAMNDPHMLTFGGRSYENQKPAKYLLYKHNHFETEVQLWTKQWKVKPSVSLNCGIAIRAGRDIFVYNTCEGHTEINFKICDDAVLHRRVIVKEGNYEVYLPTGTAIVISPGLVSITVRPSVQDIDNTDGLCGSLDKPDIVPDPYNYRVAESNDLFNVQNYNNLKSWSEKEYLCTCDRHLKFNANTHLETFGVCDALSQNTCNDDRSKISHLDKICAFSKRLRRAVEDNDEEVFKNRTFKDLYDNHDNSLTSYVAATNYTGFVPSKHSVAKRKAYDDVSARHDCMTILNTTAFQKCSTLPYLDVTPYIQNCILDAKLTGSMVYAATHLEAIKNQCLYQLKINQPLSTEAKAELHRSWANVTDVNISQILPTYSPTASMNDTKALLQEISDIICPNECSNHGKCVHGKCICDSGYIEVDCSIDSNQPPEMTGVPDRGLCDKRRRPCEQTSVFGDNFVDTSALTCKLTSFTINAKSETSVTGSVKVPAEAMSVAEVKCKLPAVRHRRNVPGRMSDGVVAFGYNISISNNGRVFSDKDMLVVFDSKCVGCTKSAGGIVCRLTPGYCVGDGNCFGHGEESGCGFCNEDSAGELQWMQKEGCPLPSVSSSSNMWVGPAVLVHIALLVAVTID